MPSKSKAATEAIVHGLSEAACAKLLDDAGIDSSGATPLMVLEEYEIGSITAEAIAAIAKKPAKESRTSDDCNLVIAKRHTLVNALRVAAEIYGSDAHEASCHPGHERVAQAFELQQRNVLKLADQIEQVGSIQLED